MREMMTETELILTLAGPLLLVRAGKMLPRTKGVGGIFVCSRKAKVWAFPRPFALLKLSRESSQCITEVPMTACTATTTGKIKDVLVLGRATWLYLPNPRC